LIHKLGGQYYTQAEQATSSNEITLAQQTLEVGDESKNLKLGQSSDQNSFRKVIDLSQNQDASPPKVSEKGQQIRI
jgi:hypothetical protein